VIISDTSSILLYIIGEQMTKYCYQVIVTLFELLFTKCFQQKICDLPVHWRWLRSILVLQIRDSMPIWKSHSLGYFVNQ